MKRLLTIFLALIFSLTMVGAFGCNSPETGPDEPVIPGEPPEPQGPEVWLEVNIHGKSTDNYRPVCDVFDTVNLDIKTSNTPGWYIEHVVHNPESAAVDAANNVTFYNNSTILVTVIYTNGVESITKTVNIYQSHWYAAMDLYLTKKDIDNGYRAVNSYIIRASNALELTPICVIKEKPYYDTEIEEVIIEDESIIYYDPITCTLVPLKAGETKVVVEGRWHTYTSSSYTESGSQSFKGREGLLGSLGLRRELTIKVVS